MQKNSVKYAENRENGSFAGKLAGLDIPAGFQYNGIQFGRLFTKWT